MVAYVRSIYFEEHVLLLGWNSGAAVNALPNEPGKTKFVFRPRRWRVASEIWTGPAAHRPPPPFTNSLTGVPMVKTTPISDMARRSIYPVDWRRAVKDNYERYCISM